MADTDVVTEARLKAVTTALNAKTDTRKIGRFSSRDKRVPPAGHSDFIGGSIWTRQPTLRKHVNSDAMIKKIFDDLTTTPKTPEPMTMAKLRNDYELPVVYADASDPLVTVNCTGPDISRSIHGRRIPIPVGAVAPQPATNPDAALCVVVPHLGGVAYLWRVVNTWTGSGTQIDAYSGCWMPLTGDGHLYREWWGKASPTDGWAWNNHSGGTGNLYGSSNAASYAVHQGLVRASDMVAGEINHALYMRLPIGSDGFCWPAVQRGNTSGGALYPWMGARFYIDLTVKEIDAMTLKRDVKILLRAMSFERYGLLYADTGSLQVTASESRLSYTPFGMADPWETYAKANPAQYTANDVQSNVPGWYSLNWDAALDEAWWRAHLKVAAYEDADSELILAPKTASATIQPWDHEVLANSASAITLTLPAYPQPGQRYRITNAGAGVVTVAPNAAQGINGGWSSFNLTQWQSVTVRVITSNAGVCQWHATAPQAGATIS